MIKRNVLNKLEQEITRPEIVIVLGARQVGKTTVLKALQKYADKQGLKSTFYDLEQPRILADFNLSSNELIDKLSNSGEIVFIDEFQYLENASKIFKAIFDSGKKIKIFCSGSSSLAIHKHLKESLAGRRFLFRMYPLSYGEIKARYPQFSIREYVQYGGMPALLSEEFADRKQLILAELLSSYILKDVKSLLKEENVKAFNHLLYLLAENQGSMISVHSLSNQIGLSSKAVDRYLEILEQTYVNFRVYSYSNNLGNELRKSCKTYFYDLGMRNALLRDFSGVGLRKDKGVIWETYVFLALQQLLTVNTEIKFWRTKDGAEVDFILVKDRKPTPIEVKAAIKPDEIPSGVKRFLDRYKDTKTAFVVNENLESVTRYQNCDIRYITFDNFEQSIKLSISLD